MKLTKQTIETRRAALLCPPGEHRAELVQAKSAARPTGSWVDVLYRTESEHNIRMSLLVRPASRSLEGLSLDHLELLLQAIQATLGVDEVEDLGAALTEMKGKTALVEVSHATDRAGKPVARITAWRAAP